MMTSILRMASAAVLAAVLAVVVASDAAEARRNVAHWTAVYGGKTLEEAIKVACSLAPSNRYECVAGPARLVSARLPASRVRHGETLHLMVETPSVLVPAKEAQRYVSRYVNRVVAAAYASDADVMATRLTRLEQALRFSRERSGKHKWKRGDLVRFSGIVMTTPGTRTADDETIEWIMTEYRNWCRQKLEAEGCNWDEGHASAVGVTPDGFTMHEVCKCYNATPPVAGPDGPQMPDSPIGSGPGAPDRDSGIGKFGPEIDLSAEYEEDINELETTCYLAGTCNDEEEDEPEETPGGDSNPGEGGGETGEGGGDGGPAPQE